MADLRVIAFTVVVPAPEYGPVEPYDAASADRYLELLLRDPDRRSYAILRDGVHVGNVGLKHIDLKRGTSECFIEVGEQSARRHGVVLDVAFDELRLRSVRLGVFEFNAPAIALYKKLGFIDDGRLGDHWVDGRFWAVNAMRLEALDWYRTRGLLARPPLRASTGSDT